MNFSEFRIWREERLTEDRRLLDCGETNLYSALAHLRPPLPLMPASVPLHRCDLARLWLRRHSLSEDWTHRALVCRGVRHALSLIFSEPSARECDWSVPLDVYPAYLELARESRIDPVVYPTLPTPRFASVVFQGARSLLLPNPLKPLGRFLTDSECDELLDWLAAEKGRRILLDCAYDLSAPLHPTTCRLWESGRVIILHSITKGWLSPRTFGIALLPK